MGLPTIATNWSGPTGFLDEHVGYPLEYDTVRHRGTSNRVWYSFWLHASHDACQVSPMISRQSKLIENCCWPQSGRWMLPEVDKLRSQGYHTL
jgi:hypothetical protein